MFPEYAAVAAGQSLLTYKTETKIRPLCSWKFPCILTVKIHTNQKWKLERTVCVSDLDSSCCPRSNVNVISQSLSQLFVFWPRHTVCPRAVKARRHRNSFGRFASHIYERQSVSPELSILRFIHMSFSQGDFRVTQVYFESLQQTLLTANWLACFQLLEAGKTNGVLKKCRLVTATRWYKSVEKIPSGKLSTLPGVWGSLPPCNSDRKTDAVGQPQPPPSSPRAAQTLTSVLHKLNTAVRL